MLIEILLVIIVLILLIAGMGAFKFYKIIINFFPAGVLEGVQNVPEEEILSTWKYKFMLMKAYFDNGYSFLSYPKWVFAIIGIGSSIQGYNLLWLLVGAIVFLIFCFIAGWIFIKFGFLEASQEVNNQFNLFVKELRGRKTI